MKKTQIFCDRCEKEITGRNPAVIRAYYGVIDMDTEQYNMFKHFDLCNTCLDSIVIFIAGK